MTSIRWWLALLTLGLVAPASRAQYIYDLNPFYHTGSGGFSLSGSIGSKGKGSLQITVGSYSSRGYLVAPYGYGTSSQVTVLYYTPQIVVVPAPRLLLDDPRLQPLQVRP